MRPGPSVRTAWDADWDSAWAGAGRPAPDAVRRPGSDPATDSAWAGAPRLRRPERARGSGPDRGSGCRRGASWLLLLPAAARARLGRDLAARTTRLREADGDGLLAARHLLSGAAGPERAPLPLVHGLLDLLLRLLPVTVGAALPGRGLPRALLRGGLLPAGRLPRALLPGRHGAPPLARECNPLASDAVAPPGPESTSGYSASTTPVQDLSSCPPRCPESTLRAPPRSRAARGARPPRAGLGPGGAPASRARRRRGPRRDTR